MCFRAESNLIIVCTSGLCIRGMNKRLNEVWATVLATRRKRRWKGKIVSKSKEKAGDLFQLVFVLSRGITRKTDRCACGNGLVFCTVLTKPIKSVYAIIFLTKSMPQINFVNETLTYHCTRNLPTSRQNLCVRFLMHQQNVIDQIGF